MQLCWIIDNLYSKNEWQWVMKWVMKQVMWRVMWRVLLHCSTRWILQVTSTATDPHWRLPSGGQMVRTRTERGWVSAAGISAWFCFLSTWCVHGCSVGDRYTKATLVYSLNKIIKPLYEIYRFHSSHKMYLICCCKSTFWDNKLVELTAEFEQNKMNTVIWFVKRMISFL